MLEVESWYDDDDGDTLITNKKKKTKTNKTNKQTKQTQQTKPHKHNTTQPTNRPRNPPMYGMEESLSSVAMRVVLVVGTTLL